MVVFPNAKINIGLNILSKRPDGYHNIETIMYPVPWTDIMEIVPARGESTTITVTGRAVECPPEKNLVMKAYRALNERIPLPPVDIYLHKVIPDGAGLGGGSSDAAFTLLALNELLNLSLSKDCLAGIASAIGADCPFFIFNKPMLATGTGVELAGIDFSLKGYRIVIVKPAVSVPTAKAYSGVKPSVPDTPLLQRALSLAPQRWTGSIGNDFEKTVFPEYPKIAEIKNELTEKGAVYAAMSGSGSAVFGLFNADNDILADGLRTYFEDCDIFTAILS